MNDEKSHEMGYARVFWDGSRYCCIPKAFEDGGASVAAAVLGDVVRAKQTDITHDGLYKAQLPTGNQPFDTVQKAVKAFGL